MMQYGHYGSHAGKTVVTAFFDQLFDLTIQPFVSFIFFGSVHFFRDTVKGFKDNLIFDEQYFRYP